MKRKRRNENLLKKSMTKCLESPKTKLDDQSIQKEIELHNEKTGTVLQGIRDCALKLDQNAIKAPPKQRSYAARLTKHFVPKKDTNLPETFDSKRALNYKVSKLVSWIKQANNIVFFTGAGISTSCNILDFRGSDGVWSKEHRGEIVSEEDDSFVLATPSLTHMAIYQLSLLKNVNIITQNVDDLHRKSGLDPSRITELHGNLFVEECRKCKIKYYRNFDVQGMGLKRTGRICDVCTSDLFDFCLDWMDALPDEAYDHAAKLCRECDLIICLGTSLRVEPANRLPVKTARSGGKVVIINLQETPIDELASMKIHGLCDVILKRVMEELKFSIPSYIQNEEIILRSFTLPSYFKEEIYHLTGEFILEPVMRNTVNDQCIPLENIENFTEGRTENMTLQDSISAPNVNPKAYYIEILPTESIKRFIYFHTVKLVVILTNNGQNSTFESTLQNRDVANFGYRFCFINSEVSTPSSADKNIVFTIKIEWHPNLLLPPLVINHSSTEGSKTYSVPIFNIDYSCTTELELVHKVPTAKRKFFPNKTRK